MHFRQHRDVKRHMIYQASFGDRFAKPTRLLTAHMPRFEMILAPHSKPFPWNELEEFRGKAARSVISRFGFTSMITMLCCQKVRAWTLDGRGL